jgi:predicted DNA repair protein MutK
MDVGDPAKLEETRVKGVRSNRFYSSVEIMTITLNEIPGWRHRFAAAALAVVAIAITALVYGVVGLIAGDGRCRCALR